MSVEYITHDEIINQVTAALDELGITASQLVDWVQPCGCCFDCPPSMEGRIHDLWFVAQEYVRELATH